MSPSVKGPQPLKIPIVQTITPLLLYQFNELQGHVREFSKGNLLSLKFTLKGEF
jgi:hypothetical protein